MNKNERVGIIGCGNMGTAFIEGLLSSNTFQADKIYVSDTDIEKIKNIQKKYKVHSDTISGLVMECNIICLIVKPKDIKTVCLEIKKFIAHNKIIISFIAGIKISRIEQIFEKDVPVLRIMPNLSVSIGKGIIGYSKGKYFPDSLLQKIAPIFKNLGFLFPINEEKMYLLTAVSGSGPGYLFYFGEIIYKILLNNGFSHESSKKIVGYLFEGSGKMMNENEDEPGILKARVSSPGGTTVAGLEVLKKYRIEEIFREVIKTAEEKAIELSAEL
ncbi:MAG: pyrroline-5-carboxylate reductase [Candidatus Omnitrophica bacterium]|nr:pyrroline-5-carboxylate reductase [Candidatus Omnitrophota bacterium]